MDIDPPRDAERENAVVVRHPRHATARVVVAEAGWRWRHGPQGDVCVPHGGHRGGRRRRQADVERSDRRRGRVARGDTGAHRTRVPFQRVDAHVMNVERYVRTAVTQALVERGRLRVGGLVVHATAVKGVHALRDRHGGELHGVGVGRRRRIGRQVDGRCGCGLIAAADQSTVPAVQERPRRVSMDVQRDVVVEVRHQVVVQRRHGQVGQCAVVTGAEADVGAGGHAVRHQCDLKWVRGRHNHGRR